MKKYMMVLAIVLVVVVVIVLIGRNRSTSPEQEMVFGQAIVETVSVDLLETFPVQVQVTADGSLMNGCTTLDELNQSRTGSTYAVELGTKAPVDAVCTEALVPFSETFLLNGTTGVEAGEYFVDVNGVRGSFAFDIDNFLTDFDPQK